MENVNGWLDGLPPFLRHLILMMLATLLSWAGSDLVPLLNGHPGWGALAGTLLVAILAWVTPMTRQYGVGARSGAARDSLDRAA